LSALNILLTRIKNLEKYNFFMALIYGTPSALPRPGDHKDPGGGTLDKVP